MNEPAVWAMSRSLTGVLPTRALPAGYRLAHWRSEDAAAVHALLRDAYARGGGSVDADRAHWQREFEGDVEFDPHTCWLAFDASGLLASAALCWNSGFIKDLVTHEAVRTRGLGSALLSLAMAEFARRGLTTLRLKVERDNPSGARALYEELGFSCVASAR